MTPYDYAVPVTSCLWRVHIVLWPVVAVVVGPNRHKVTLMTLSDSQVLKMTMTNETTEVKSLESTPTS